MSRRVAKKIIFLEDWAHLFFCHPVTSDDTLSTVGCQGCQLSVKEIKMPQVFAPYRKEQGVKVSSVNLDTPLKRYINK